MSDFTACARCGKIFLNPGKTETLCPRCRGDEAVELSARDALRLVKNTLRDAQAAGALMTMPEVARATGVSEDRVWGFITSGEIDTASFDDPQVRDFVHKRRRELLKQGPGGAEEQSEPGKPRSGFHMRTDDERRR
jgi:hypothetical protein